MNRSPKTMEEQSTRPLPSDSDGKEAALARLFWEHDRVAFASDTGEVLGENGRAPRPGCQNSVRVLVIFPGLGYLPSEGVCLLAQKGTNSSLLCRGEVVRNLLGDFSCGGPLSTPLEKNNEGHALELFGRVA